MNPDGTVPYTGASYTSRSATWRDPNLRNAYIMNWSAGFQFQFKPTWLFSAMYQGTAGVGLQKTWNINQIPLSLALGNDRALQDMIVTTGRQQDYVYYPQFGNVYMQQSTGAHSQYHAAIFQLRKRVTGVWGGSFSYTYSRLNDNQFGASNYYTSAPGVANAGEFAGVVRRHSQIERIVAGHLHRPIQSRVGGALASTAPSTAHQVALDLEEQPLAFTLARCWCGRAATVSISASDCRVDAAIHKSLAMEAKDLEPRWGFGG